CPPSGGRGAFVVGGAGLPRPPGRSAVGGDLVAGGLDLDGGAERAADRVDIVVDLDVPEHPLAVDGEPGCVALVDAVAVAAGGLRGGDGVGQRGLLLVFVPC